MRYVNKYPKIPYSAMAREVEVIRKLYPGLKHHQKLTSASDWQTQS